MRLDPRLKRLEAFEFFKQHQEFFKKVLHFIEFKKYNLKEIILKEEDRIEGFYWVVEGTVGITTTLSFMKTPKGLKPATEPLEGEKFDIVIEQGELSLGSFFPYVPFEAAETNLTSKTSCYHYRVKNQIGYTFATLSKECMVAFISFEDFMEFITLDQLTFLIKNSSFQRFKKCTLQSIYMEQITWEKAKKRILEESKKK